MRTIHATLAVLVCLGFAALAPAQDAPKPVAPAPAAEPATKAETTVADITREGKAAGEIVETDLARAFLAAAEQLPSIEPRTFSRDPKTRKAYTEAQFAALSEEKRAPLKKRAYDTRFYYTTGYGSPTIYARPL